MVGAIRVADALRKVDECKIEEIIKRFKTTTKKHVRGFYVKWQLYVGDITGVYSSTELIAAASKWIIDHIWKHIRNDMEGLDKARFETHVEANIQKGEISDLVTESGRFLRKNIFIKWKNKYEKIEEGSEKGKQEEEEG